MAQKRKTDQSKLAASTALLKKLEEKTARAVKGNLGDNWRDNLFEILMTRLELAAPHKKAYAAIPGALRREPREIQKFARLRDRELGRSGEPEADGLALPRGPQPQPPGLDIDAFIPEAGLGGGDGHVHGAGDVEVDEVVTRGDVGHVDRFAVHGDGEGRGPHLRLFCQGKTCQ